MRHGMAALAAAAFVVWGCLPAAADIITPGTAPSISATEGMPIAQAVALFSDSVSGLPVSDFIAGINWGDGTVSFGTVGTGAGNQYSVFGSHTYTEEGSYSPSISITSNQGGSATVQAGATVADASLGSGVFQSAFATEGAQFSATLATFQDANSFAAASDFAATINWDDGTTSSGTVVSAGNGLFNITGSHTYAEEGSYSVQIAIEDMGGSTLQFGGTALAVTFFTTVGAFLPYTAATFVDNGPSDGASDFSATINWGDNTSSVGTVLLSGGSFLVQGTHAYLSSGNYPVTTNVTDDGGATTSIKGTAVVSAVPEPAGWILIAAGGAGLFSWRRRRCPNSGL
jgi:PKD repeat protein